jgi:DNA-binding NarL/FixJ family response regulator
MIAEYTSKRISVIIADDHEIVRFGLRRYLANQEMLDVIAEADNGQDAVLLATLYQPDIVLLDINMPKLDGLDATIQIKKTLKTTKVIVLSAHEDSYHLEKALQAGADGYLSKEIEMNGLTHALMAVLNNEKVYSPSILALIRKGTAHHLDYSAPPVSLTKREQEVLGLVVKGMTSIEIADMLSISSRTVETHRFNLLSKLGVKNTAGLIRFALISSPAVE